MSTEITVSADVKEFIQDILVNNDFQTTSKVMYKPGSEIGDNYASQTISVDIEDQGKSLHLFLKCAIAALSNEKMPEFGTIFAIETFFYEVLHPTYQKFLRDHNVEGFQNVPKYYGASKKQSREIIAMENLRYKGYGLFDRYDVMNDEHLSLVLKAFAKFHATSFAFKDQNREIYDKWQENIMDFSTIIKSGRVDQIMIITLEDFISRLDPENDNDIMEKCEEFKGQLKTIFETLLKEYTIITKGDCWVNNSMFLYDQGSKDKPSDVMLIDWQMLRDSSPVYDLITIFYPTASKKALDNVDYYLKIYHNELSGIIRKLGSDPEVLYPYSVFEKEWNDLAAFAFGNALLILKIMLTEKEETADVEHFFDESIEKLTDVYPTFKNQDLYMERVKTIIRHLIKRKLL